MAEISLSKYSGNLAEHVAIRDSVTALVTRFSPIMQHNISLPSDMTGSSPSILYAKAAEARSWLDSTCALLSVCAITKMQVNDALRLSRRIYEQAIQAVCAINDDCKKAKGYAEKELIARRIIDQKIKEDYDFWKDTLDDIIEVMELIKIKERTFSGVLGTILTQSGLTKMSISMRGFTLGADEIEKLNQATKQAQEGTFKLGED